MNNFIILTEQQVIINLEKLVKVYCEKSIETIYFKFEDSQNNFTISCSDLEDLDNLFNKVCYKILTQVVL